MSVTERENPRASYKCTQPPALGQRVEQDRVRTVALPGRIGGIAPQIRIADCMTPAPYTQALEVVEYAKFTPGDRSRIEVESRDAARQKLALCKRHVNLPQRPSCIQTILTLVSFGQPLYHWHRTPFTLIPA
jgi:hypothetical protein